MQTFSSEYKIDEPKFGLKKNLILLAGLALVAALVVGIYYFTKVNRAATSESHEIQFTISKGMSTRAVATSLSEKEVISNKNIFIIYSTLHGVGDKIQAGEYSLNSNMTVAEIVDVLTHGKVVPSSRKATLLEGVTNDQIAKELEKKNIVASRDFLLAITDNSFDFKYLDAGAKFNYQGFLFPDTYEFGKDVTVKEVVQKMLTNFESKFTDKMSADMQARNLKLADVINLASIIEKEVGRNQEKITDEDLAELQRERELVASVFYNRLSIGMGLESDATVNYVTGKADRSVTIADTKIKSPYNTYQVKGLPPTPISNPGLGSIKAAIYAPESDYLYFLNAPNGTAYFAKTLDEHNANKAKYLK